MAYQCNWEREDNPTRGMKSGDAAAYWKAHQVHGDCDFALRPDGDLSDELCTRWRELLTLVLAAKKGEQPKHRTMAANLRHAWRQWKSDTVGFPPLVMLAAALAAAVEAEVANVADAASEAAVDDMDEVDDSGREDDGDVAVA